jgi:hypothetical protein
MEWRICTVSRLGPPLLSIGFAAVTLISCASAGENKAATSTKTRSRHCLPAWPTAYPTRISAGDVVAVRSRGLRCDPFPRPDRYTVVLYAPTRRGGLPDYGNGRRLMTFDVDRHGRFLVRIVIPTSTLPGSAALWVRGKELNRRIACPPNAACRAYSAGIIVDADHAK